MSAPGSLSHVNKVVATHAVSLITSANKAVAASIAYTDDLIACASKTIITRAAYLTASANKAVTTRAAHLIAVMAAVLMLCSAQAQAQSQPGTCGPAQIGHPCPTDGPATQAAATPTLNLGAGNPVHLATGNKTRRDTDLPAAPSSPGLEIVRHYNALDPRPHPLGLGWSWTYDTRLHLSATLAQIVQADGSRIDFGITGQDNDCVPRQAGTGTLTRTATGWTWQWPDHRQLTFDHHGQLASIIRPGGGVLALERDKRPGPTHGLIKHVRDNSGDTLTLHYELGQAGARLARIDTALGTFTYQHAPAPHGKGWLLTQVRRPDGMRQRYHYDPQRQSGHPHALTGAELIDQQGHTLPLGSWSYDAAGRVATADPPGMRFAYLQSPAPNRPGITSVTTEAGTTEFHIHQRGTRYQLSKVVGPGCPACPAPGLESHHSLNGQQLQLDTLRMQTNADGHITHLALDDSGWPALTLDYQDGQLTAWSSSVGGEQRLRDPDQGTLERRHANGDRWIYHQDQQGRPVSLTALSRRPQTDPITLQLSWRGQLLTGVQSPHETEQRRYDAHGRLSARRISRPATADGVPALEYEDRYHYDAAGRLREHRLPEGGTLRYDWHDARLTGIDWTNAAGHTQAIVRQADATTPGYVHANQLYTLGWTQADQLAGLLVSRPQPNQPQLATAAATTTAAVTTVTTAPTTPAATTVTTASTTPAATTSNTAATTTAATTAADNNPAPPLFVQQLHYTPQGQLSSESLLTNGQQSTSHYAYDSSGRLLVAHTHGSPQQHYAWHADGSARHAPQLQRDPSGLPQQAAGRLLHHDALHRLQSVWQNGQRLLYQHHDAQGRRILRQDATGTVQYLYADNRLAAEVRTVHGTTGITRRYIHAGWTPVAVIDYHVPQPLNGLATPTNRQASLYAIHADSVGLPRLVTDAQGQVRWQARFSAFGRAEHISGNLTLDLRLPGQIYDASTGWHDNGLRTYDPAAGHYLQPDPLGPLPGTQAYGYAAQQPRRHADPLGLLLFAFDGTRNAPSSLTNVWLLSQAYADGPVRYHHGPGTPAAPDLDAATAYTAPVILATQWERLLADLSAARFASEPVNIDLLGYSRGAALARHFGNLIAERVRNGRFWLRDSTLGTVTACVGLRFMGLFDTVAQFGLLGVGNHQYDLTVTDAWQWVAHAVALHEHRRLFPLTVLEGSPGGHLIEAPFVGAHADIGGGYLAAGTPPDQQGDLSDVALNWMRWQALAAGVPIDELPPEQQAVTQPLLHDQRAASSRRLLTRDRAVFDAEDEQLNFYQREHPRYGDQARRDTEAFIRRLPGWNRRSADGNVVGHIDMDAYRRWLAQEIGFDDLP